MIQYYILLQLCVHQKQSKTFPGHQPCKWNALTSTRQWWLMDVRIKATLITQDFSLASISYFQHSHRLTVVNSPWPRQTQWLMRDFNPQFRLLSGWTDRKSDRRYLHVNITVCTAISALTIVVWCVFTPWLFIICSVFWQLQKMDVCNVVMNYSVLAFVWSVPCLTLPTQRHSVLHFPEL